MEWCINLALLPHKSHVKLQNWGNKAKIGHVFLLWNASKHLNLSNSDDNLLKGRFGSPCKRILQLNFSFEFARKVLPVANYQIIRIWRRQAHPFAKISRIISVANPRDGHTQPERHTDIQTRTYIHTHAGLDKPTRLIVRDEWRSLSNFSLILFLAFFFYFSTDVKQQICNFFGHQVLC
jgi:hypothetical protein